MEKYIIIRAGVNGGKTTTSGLLFEKLSKKADYSKIFNNSFKEFTISNTMKMEVYMTLLVL